MALESTHGAYNIHSDWPSLTPHSGDTVSAAIGWYVLSTGVLRNIVISGMY